ncbi:TPA: Bardet-Biedl syndrome 4 protein [Trebouxia sp. C0004]
MATDAEQLPSRHSRQHHKSNFLIHQLFLRQDLDECLSLIEASLADSQGSAEYALYIKGQLSQSLQLFQQAAAVSPNNLTYHKQVGRTLLLLGSFEAAVQVFEEATQLAPRDWELWHNKGACYMAAKKYDWAADFFVKANSIEQHDSTFLQLGKVYALQADYQAAVKVCLEALVFCPDNAEVLTTIGLLYLRMGESLKAFDFLGNSLSNDPRNVKSILAAASVIQDHHDMDVALVKYRVAAVQTPNSPQLWNNIGMCFFGKQKHVAAISCLKKASYLGPFEWIVSYNLGLLHLATGQYASAFHHFSSSINIKSDFAHTYMYLAVALAKLDDVDNASAAYEKAIELDDDMMFRLNYAITLSNYDEPDLAQEQFDKFERIFSIAGRDTQTADANVVQQRQLLLQILNSR